MPELPEIQAHAERLTEGFAGTELTRFVPLSFTALKTVDPPPEEAVGRSLDGVARRGKHLLLEFGDLIFVVHLMQGGRLSLDGKQSKKPRFGLARWVFADDRALLLTEAGTDKRAGVWVLRPPIEEQDPLEGLGPEADTLDTDTVAAALSGRSTRLHGLLRDQRVVAGIGRRLANEICHRAKLSPFANSGKLDKGEIERLADAIKTVIAESLTDERARDNMSKAKDRPSAVHHRAGEECPVCGNEVRSVEYRKYTVNYCATCQTDGKILADNTTSKFLK